MEIQTFLDGLDRYKEQLSGRRRDFHRHAEPGWREFYTTSKIAETLGSAGIPFLYGDKIINRDYLWSYPSEKELDECRKRAVSQGADPSVIERIGDLTGACALIETGRPGPVVALRFDIDCNDVSENDAAGHIPSDDGFRSENAGCMHACGHDGHASIGLAVCLAVNEIRDSLCGTVKIIFQPAEEGVRGAKSIAESGILDDVDIFLTAHLGMGVKTGQLLALSKGFLSTTKVDAEFTGVSAHAGASPQDGRNAILAACAATLAVHTVCQDSRGTSRVNVGMIRGGSGRNVVAEKAYLQLETRGETAEIEQDVYKRAIESIEGAAKMFGCTVKTAIMGSASSSDSDEELGPYIRAAAARVPEITELLPSGGFSGSEDATYLMAKVQEHGGKAAYMCVGSDIAAPHHNNRFDIDERSLLIGLKLYVSAVWEILHIA